MKKLYTLIICMGFLQMGLGQVATNYNAKWFFGVNTGLTWQTTDVSNKYKTGWGLTLGKSFNYNTASFVSFDLRGRFLRGFWYGQDKEASNFIDPNNALSSGATNYKDSLGYAVHNFQTENYLLNLELVAHLNRLRETTRWDAYIFGGIGLNWNQTYGDYLNRNQTTGDLSLYNWDLNTLSKSSINNLQDGVYETALDGSKQDGFNFFTSSSLGFGLGYQVSKTITIGAEHKTTFTNIDNFDGLSSSIRDGNDIYHYTNAFVRFRLFGGRYDEEVTKPLPPVIEFRQPNVPRLTVGKANYIIQAKIKNVADKQNVVFIQNGATITNFTFNPRSELFSANVTLVEGQNNFVLTGNNQYGTDTETTIIIYKPQLIQPPVVTFTQPSVNPTTVASPNYNLTANVTNVTVKNDVQVNVNGTSRTDFNFNTNNGNVLLTLKLNPGTNTVQITGTNSAGIDVESTTLIYKVDPVKTPPVVYFTDPSSNSTAVGTNNYTVKGKVQNVESTNGVNFTQNGSNKTNFSFNPSSDDFTFSANLTVGQNTFVLAGTNTDGTASATTVIIYNRAELKPPVVTISNPNGSNVTVNNAQYPFVGNIQNISSQSQASMVVNGSTMSGFSFNPSTGTVTANLNLVEGSNVVSLTGNNADGTDSKQVTIVYTKVVTVQPPVVYFTDPGTNPKTVNVASYTIRGKVLNVDGPLNVTFKKNNVNQTGFIYNPASDDFVITLSLVQGQNVFELTGTNSAGSSSATTIINYAPILSKPPVVSISNPSGGSASTSVAQYPFVGNVQNVTVQSQVSMLVNGSTFSGFTFNSTSGAVTANLSLNSGANTVKLTGTNADGTDSQQATIVYTPVSTVNPPIVTYIDPGSNPLTVNASSYNVRATIANVSSPSGVNIEHNGSNISVFTFGSNMLTFSLNLNEGANAITVTGTNTGGVDTKTTTIVYTKPVLNKPPTVTFTNPSSSGTSVSSDQFTVNATILEIATKAQISFKKNGTMVSPSAYTFNSSTNQLSYPTILNEGNNTFEITATNIGGNDSKSTSIFYKAPPCDKPVVTALTPSSSAYATDQASFQISVKITGITSKSQIDFNAGAKRVEFEYNPTTGVLTSTVNLSVGLNSISISATNNCGSDIFTYKIVRTACESPTLGLNFANVGNNQTTLAPNVTLLLDVSAITSNSQVSAQMNNKAIPFDFNLANRTIEIEKSILAGSSSFVITVTNSCGSETYTHNVTRDKSPTKNVPTVNITNPNGSTTSVLVSAFTLQFSTTQIIDKGEIIVRVNGVPTDVSFNNTANSGTAVLKLNSGSNDIKITVTNPVGSASDSTIIVNSGKSGTVTPKNSRGGGRR
ncbi:MAG: hypothetical protein P8M61_01370 [Crocinitomicaceae bacterium]|nr:hypothetical protein [Crocinitomicaceae bacterium]